MMSDIMVVEDDLTALRALLALLGAAGLAADGFVSAEEAITAIGRFGTPRVIVSDLQLPGMSGETLIRHVRGLKPEVMSVLMSATDVDRLQRAGRMCSGICLSKPLDHDRLVSLIRGRHENN